MASRSSGIQKCRACGASGTGKYCHSCGQSFALKRITLQGLLHDVFHLFTHLEKGFGYTLKNLIILPGTMQRLYVEGQRSKHQKPFSMFFICASLSALVRYWIYRSLNSSSQLLDSSETSFFHEYMVLLYVAILPLYVLAVWLAFRGSRYNYAEVGVMQLYLFSFFFIVTIAIALLKYVWVRMDTAYVEVPIFLVYNIITFVNFFQQSNKLWVAAKSILLFAAVFILAQVTEDFVIGLINNKR